MPKQLHQGLYSPATVRVLPFAVFLGLTCLQGVIGPGSQYWVYLVKTIVGAGMLWLIWPRVTELKITVSPASVVAGVAAFAIWVGLDSGWTRQPEIWTRLGIWSTGNESAPEWNPLVYYAAQPVLGRAFVCVRLLGSALVVPPIEEMFYRSFLYRYLVRTDFENIPLSRFVPGAFFVTALVFGFAHKEWMAGILTAGLYQYLVLRQGHLGEAIVAHGITNLCLGVWVVLRDQWHFW